MHAIENNFLHYNKANCELAYKPQGSDEIEVWLYQSICVHTYTHIHASISNGYEIV